MAGLRSGRRRRRKPGWSTDAHEIVDRLFVYGNLRRGQPARNQIADHVVSWQPATARGRIYALPDGYPGLVPGGDGQVTGEVVVLRDLAAVFPLLDAFEGENYARVLQKAVDAAGAELSTWVYALADPVLAEHGEPIESGDWVAWQSAKPSS